MLQDPILPKDSLILITAVNGLIGAHLVNESLAAGYRVRGSVRSISRNKWMTQHFDEAYGPSRFTLVEIPDIYTPHAYDEAVKGVDGFIHAAASVNFDIKDLEGTCKAAENSAIAALAAARAAGVKAVAMTSSSWALYTPHTPNLTYIDEASWNDAAVKLAFSDAPPSEKHISAYMTEKVRIEKAVWAWIEREKPSFQFSTVPTSTVFGPVVKPVEQGYGTSAGFLKQVFDDKPEDMVRSMPPQWFVDVRDVARLHLAGLINPKADRRRILGFAERFNWDLVTKIFKEKVPDREFESYEGAGLDTTERVGNELSVELLRDAGQDGFTSLRDSLRDAVDVFLQAA